MHVNGAKKYFFITTYDNISAVTLNTLLNMHPNFRCQQDQSATLLPAVSPKSLDEYLDTNNEKFFSGNIQGFTAFELDLAKRKETFQGDITTANIVMPITLRVRLLLHHWLNLGLSDESLLQRLTTELQLQQVMSVLDKYNFNANYQGVWLLVSRHIVAKGVRNTTEFISARARIFYIALALSISLDEMDTMVDTNTIVFDKILGNYEEFFNIFTILTNQNIELSLECKEQLISSLSNFNENIIVISQLVFWPWQDELLSWFYDNNLNKQLRVNTIQSSFLSLFYSINAFKNTAYDDYERPFYLSNNQLLLRDSKIHYELVLIGIPMQMRNRSVVLPKSVLQNIDNPNTRFIYDLSYEAVTFCDGNLEDWLTMHRLLQDAGVPAHRVFFICSNYNVKKYYSQWADKHNISYRFNVFGNHYWPLKRAWELVRDHEFQKIKYQLIDVAKQTVEKNIYRPFYFMCLNLKTRFIRTVLLSFLLQRNYFSKGIITYLGRDDLTPSEKKITDQYDHFYTPDEMARFLNRLPEGELFWQCRDQLEQMTPLVYDVQANQAFDANWPLNYLIPELGKYGKVDNFESYFEIVTETYFLNDETLNITEKTVKPILRFQIFIIVGSPFTLSSLRELGFQTFSPYIDETYDTVIDPAQRLTCIMKEIDRLCNLSIDELHNLYCTLWPRILHNYKRLTENAYDFLTVETNKLMDELTCC